MSFLDTLLTRAKTAWQNANQNTPAVEQYLSSLGHSAYSGASDAVKAVGHAAAHPIQTIEAAPAAVGHAAKSAYDIVNGAGAEGSYLAGLGDNNQENRQKFMNVVNEYKEHYGSLDGFTDYLKNHPYAVAGDVAGLFVPLARGASAVASKGLLKGAEVASAFGKADEAAEVSRVPPMELPEVPEGQRQSLVSHTSEVPSSRSVKPMDPKEMARVMNDPEAVGGAPKGGIIPPEELGNVSLVEHEQPSVDAQAQANDALAPQPVSDTAGVPKPNTSGMEYNQITPPEDAAHFESAPANENQTPVDHGIDPSMPDFMKQEIIAQRLDATGIKQPVDNTGYEAHTPYVGEPNSPANDPTRLAAAKGLFQNIMSDERGSLGYKGDETPESPVTPDMKSRLYDAISDVKPKLSEQRVLNREDKQQKVAIGSALREGGADVATQKTVLNGEVPKVSYQPLKDQFTPEEQASFRADMNSNKKLSFFDNTMAQDAFDKLTGTHPDGGIPTQSELDALQKAYPQLKGKLGTAGDYLTNLLGIARATKTIGDLGVALRQASPLIGTKEYWGALTKMFGNIASENRYQAVMDGIKSRPNYNLMKEAGIAFTDLGHDLTAREDFAPSVWAEKIPGVRMSERGFTGFLNQIRADTADRLINAAKDAGVNIHDEDFLNQLGSFVNNTTGRGSFKDTFGIIGEGGKTFGKAVDQAAPLMASVFFSPRLMASRLNLLGRTVTAPLEAGKTLVNAFKPGTFETLHPMLQREYMKSLIGYTAFQTATMSIMKGLGAKIETDPRSTDFGRGTFQNTHFDLTGGFQPYVRAAAQILSLSKKNAEGDIVPLNDGSTLGATAGSVGLNLMRGKLSPMVGFGLDMALGKDFVGNKVSFTDIYKNIHLNMDKNDDQSITNNPAVKLYIPMAAGAMMDAMKEYGAKSPLPYAAGAAEIFGGAAHTYAPQEPKTKGSFNSAFGGNFESKFNSGFTSKFGGGF